jgi:hypothetical protein
LGKRNSLDVDERKKSAATGDASSLKLPESSRQKESPYLDLSLGVCYKCGYVNPYIFESDGKKIWCAEGGGCG